MVKNIVLILTLFASTLANAQTDAYKCEEYFAHYDTLLGENLIVIWETPPILKKCSHKEIGKLEKLVSKQESYEYILADMIIDSEGVPICFRFKQEVETKIKSELIEKLKLLRFKPAMRDGKRVESIYTIKI